MQHKWESFPSTGHKIGLGLIASAGLVSALSTFALLLYIGWTVWGTDDKLKPFSRGLRTFTSSFLGWFLISLLLCDFLQGVAFSLNFHWAALGKMGEVKLCMIQGAVSQVGDLGAAIWSIAIAFHTFWLLFLVKQPHRLAELFTLIGGWSVIVFLPVIGPTVIQRPTRGSFYGLSGAWCWIGTRYGPERVIYLYGWVFVALGSSFIIYTLIYLRFSGFITFDEGGKVHFHFRRCSSTRFYASSIPSPNGTSTSYGPRITRGFACSGSSRKQTMGSNYLENINIGEAGCETSKSAGNAHFKRVARRIMWYPLLYAVVVIPVSVCRMAVLSGWEPPFGLLVFAGICFGSSGLTNTVLFLTTRRRFIISGDNAPTPRVHITTQHFTTHDYSSSTNDGDIKLDSIKFSNSRGDSPDADTPPIVFYHSRTPQTLDREVDAVMIIANDQKIGENYADSN